MQLTSATTTLVPLLLVMGSLFFASSSHRLADGSSCNSMNSRTSVVELSCGYKWEVLVDVDNTDNTGEIRYTETATSSVRLNYRGVVRDMQRHVSDDKVSFDLSLDIVKVDITSRVHAEHGSRKVVEYESTVEHEITKSEERTLTTDIRVGARSMVKIYRLVYNCPGLFYKTTTLSTTPYKVDDVNVHYTVQRACFLKDIHVTYAKDAVSKPYDSLVEQHGRSTDVNAGFGGEFVYLVPVWTDRVSEAVTSIEVIIQREENRSFRDLSKGAGGDYRYLKMMRNPYSHTRVTKVGLWRAPNASPTPGSRGWNSWTGDINRNRGGDFLYVCWMNREV